MRDMFDKGELMGGGGGEIRSSVETVTPCQD